MAYRFSTSERDPFDQRAEGTGSGWSVAFAAARKAEGLSESGRRAAFAVDWALAEADEEQSEALLREVADDAVEAALVWWPESGWELRLPVGDRRAALIDLYLPV